jgi:hypothetical protein
MVRTCPFRPLGHRISDRSQLAAFFFPQLSDPACIVTG